MRTGFFGAGAIHRRTEMVLVSSADGEWKSRGSVGLAEIAPRPLSMCRRRGSMRHDFSFVRSPRARRMNWIFWRGLIATAWRLQ
jgi:hypothetical protein